MAINIENAKNNKEILTGRRNGDYFEEGQPRGGGARAERIETTIYEAINIPIEQVLQNTGVILEKDPTPYKEKTAAVKPVVVRSTIFFNHRGEIIKPHSFLIENDDSV